jgi:hypothetical protein
MLFIQAVLTAKTSLTLILPIASPLFQWTNLLALPISMSRGVNVRVYAHANDVAAMERDEARQHDTAIGTYFTLFGAHLPRIGNADGVLLPFGEVAEKDAQVHDDGE